MFEKMDFKIYFDNLKIINWMIQRVTNSTNFIIRFLDKFVY